MAEGSNGNDGLKMLTTFFAGIILTGIGAFVAYPHNLPTKDDIAQSQAVTEKEITEVQAQLATTQASSLAIQDEITKMRLQLAKVSFKLNIPDNQ